MLRWWGASIALAGVSVMAWWAMTSGATAQTLANDMEIPFAGLGALMAGTFAWMLGMARREVEQDAEWARVDRLVAGAREEMIAAGFIAEPTSATPSPPEPRVTRSHSRAVDRVRAEAPVPARPRRTRNGFRVGTARPRPSARRATPAREVEAPVERPRPRPRTAAARAAAART